MPASWVQIDFCALEFNITLEERDSWRSCEMRMFWCFYNGVTEDSGLMGRGTASMANWVTIQRRGVIFQRACRNPSCDEMLTKRGFEGVWITGTEQVGWWLHWRTGLTAAVAPPGNFAASALVFIYTCLTGFLPVCWCVRSMAKRRRWCGCWFSDCGSAVCL